MRRVFILVLAALAVPCFGSENWERFQAEAERLHGEPGRAAAAFLAEHRPERDEDLDVELLLENLHFALRARREFPWASDISDEMFLNDVLPYAVFDETRDGWRASLYESCRKIVADCGTATEAAQALNRELFNEIGVHYNTGRKAPNQSLSESREQGRATCTGLSIILVNACRTVGVPARAAGVANWHDDRGNHTWVEVWDGEWHFTGADEYNGKGLNRAWFVGSARRATPGDPEHAVWATSWRRTGDHFPLVWARGDESVPGVEVTERYVPAERIHGPQPTYIRLWDTEGGQRLVGEVEIVGRASMATRGGRSDLNDMPSFTFAAGEPHDLRVRWNEQERRTTFRRKLGDTSVLELYWDELALSGADAEALVLSMWQERAAAIIEARADEIAGDVVRVGKHEMKLLTKTFGEEPEGGHSIWISMHGGGGAPTEVNDRQWKNQIRLYELEEGIYIAPRAPTDTWNLWHRAHIDDLFDRLIETLVARGANADRVYLLGYSAGGDGVYQLAPRMADRFAAACMMAGHPNESKPLGLRNLPFAIFMGGEDGAYKRNEVAASWGARLAELQAADPSGYEHRVTIYPGKGHWMDGEDAEGLPWMAERVRDPWPSRVVWHQDDVTHERFYWLGVSEDDATGGSVIRAEVDGQTIRIESEDVRRIRLRLHDALLDLDAPVVVEANGKVVFEGRVSRTEAAIRRSLEERNDAASAATADLVVSWKK